jgi:uncharacterized membrane protein
MPPDKYHWLSSDFSGYLNLYISNTLFIIVLSSTIFLKVLYLASNRPKTQSSSSPLFKLLSPVYFLIALYIATFGFLSIQKHNAFHSYTDIAVHSEILWKILQGNGPITTIELSLGPGHGIQNYLSAHMIPFAYILTPIFFLFPSPKTLLLFQTIILSLGALPIYWFAKERIKSEFSGIAFASAYLLYPTLQYTNLFEYHDLPPALPLILFTFYYLWKKKYKAFFLFMSLAMMVREEVSLTIFMLGLYAFFIQKNRKLGILVSSVAILYIIAILGFVMPQLRDASSSSLVYLYHYKYLGDTPLEIFNTIIFHPIYVLKHLFTPLKIGNLTLFLLPIGFLCLFAPTLLMLGLPSFATTFLSGSIEPSTFFLYYTAPSLPFLFFASIEGTRNIVIKVVPFLGKKFKGLNQFSEKGLIFSLGNYVLITGLLTNFFFGPSPISRQFWDKDYRLAEFHTHNFHHTHYKVTNHHRLAQEFLSQIPDQTIVSAQTFLLPHLFKKKKIYMYPYIGDAEYILLDKENPERSPGDLRVNFDKYLQRLLHSRNWSIISAQDGYMLFKRIPCK